MFRPPLGVAQNLPSLVEDLHDPGGICGWVDIRMVALREHTICRANHFGRGIPGNLEVVVVGVRFGHGGNVIDDA
jgi:hypothetical protein